MPTNSDIIYNGEILACPFCGNSAFVKKSSFSSDLWFVECKGRRQCPVEPSTLFHANPQAAIAAWNTRTMDHHENATSFPSEQSAKSVVKSNSSTTDDTDTTDEDPTGGHDQ